MISKVRNWSLRANRAECEARAGSPRDFQGAEAALTGTIGLPSATLWAIASRASVPIENASLCIECSAAFAAVTGLKVAAPT